MENYLFVNGIKLKLTEEQSKQLGFNKNTSCFNRVSFSDEYYYISEDGKVEKEIDCNFQIDEDRYNMANYCARKDYLEERLNVEILSRLLWRYSLEHKGNEIDWKNPNQRKYFIFQNTMADTWSVSSRLYNKKNDSTYFISQEIAQRAIDEIVKPFFKNKRKTF